MGLSDIGSIVWKKWYEIPNHKEYINLDEFIVMPDHIHGLLEITSSGSESGGSCRGKTPQTQYQNKFGKPQSRSLSMVINHFKGSVTKWCNKNGIEDFRWQSSFQDEVLFNRNSINRIRKYIQDNPLKWNASGK